MRLDTWLWQARFFRTRALAHTAIEAGQVRVNGVRVSRPGRAVGPGDTLTFPQGSRIRIVRITGLPERRGPATEAQGFYVDLDAELHQPSAHPGATPSGLE